MPIQFVEKRKANVEQFYIQFLSCKIQECESQLPFANQQSSARKLKTCCYY